MLWPSNQWTDQVFRRCAGCKPVCSATPHKRCQSSLQGSSYIYLSQLSTTLGHWGQMMQLFDIPFRSQIAEHKPNDLCPVLHPVRGASSSAVPRPLLPQQGQHPALVRANTDQQERTPPLVLGSQVPSHRRSYCSSRPAGVYSVCENSVIQFRPRLEKTQSVNFSSSFDKIYGEQLCKQLFQQVGGVGSLGWNPCLPVVSSSHQNVSVLGLILTETALTLKKGKKS